MVNMAAELEAGCKRQHGHDGSVFPPQVCRFCMGCPLGTIVMAVSNDQPVQRGPDEIPDENEQEVRDWLATVPRRA